MFSGGHCLLDCCLNTKIEGTSIPKQFTRKQNLPKWDSRLSNEFVSNISNEIITDIFRQVNGITQCPSSLEQRDCIINQLNDVFIESAAKTFRIKSKTIKPNKPRNKPWFGTEGKKAKKTYNKSRKKFSKNPFAQNRSLLKITCKNI